MNITLTPAQQSFIQAKIQTGKYKSTQEVIEMALRLFEEYEQAESEWSQSIREKIQAAAEALEQTPPIDGENFVEGILQRFKES
ncbi:MAG: type II toxin-antitoxin system ParD family antitoxin [Cyanobacteria bacterium P01_A01_bin.83]